MAPGWAPHESAEQPSSADDGAMRCRSTARGCSPAAPDSSASRGLARYPGPRHAIRQSTRSNRTGTRFPDGGACPTGPSWQWPRPLRCPQPAPAAAPLSAGRRPVWHGQVAFPAQAVRSRPVYQRRAVACYPSPGCARVQTPAKPLYSAPPPDQPGQCSATAKLAKRCSDDRQGNAGGNVYRPHRSCVARLQSRAPMQPFPQAKVRRPRATAPRKHHGAAGQPLLALPPRR